MNIELRTQSQLDAFTEEVAQLLGTHCRTAELTGYGAGLGRLIIDDDGRALRLCQPEARLPDRLKISAAMPDDSEVTAPSIGVTALSARHVTREITRRLVPLHIQAAAQEARLVAHRRAEEAARRVITDAVAEALPGARVEEGPGLARVHWERDTQTTDKRGFAVVAHVTVTVGVWDGRVEVEASGRPDAVVAMLAAFARATPG
ncbi:hypothetical protein [Streptomyces sp. N35]|uniref:hypothetical protein n=1 Tax=Streptomyces sp. N35 TaxID=2795730 RepID=UPI0018F69538|nr:hypothetical protein [Streptomyces sp. N35]